MSTQQGTPSDFFEFPPPAAPSGGLADGDYGDIAVSGAGTVLTIDASGMAAIIAAIDAATLGLLSAAALVTTKGGLLAFDGSAWGVFDGDGGADTRQLTANSGEAVGLEWAAA